MKSIHYTALALSVALLMTGCATNKGSFELDTAKPPQNTGNQHTGNQSTPTYADDASGTRRTETADNSEPALGYAIEIPRRNTAPNPATGTADENATVSLSDDKVVAINHKLSDLPKVFADKIEADSKFVDDNGISYSHDGKLKSTVRELDFVRSGYVIGEKRIEFVRKNGKMDIFPAGQYGYVFYQGVNPAKNLPTSTATYKGTWDFVSDAKKSRTTMADGFSNDIMNYGNAGNATGATTLDTFTNHGKGNSKPVGLTSEFTVDFASKKLTGKLTQNGWVVDDNAKQDITDRYTIDADVKGNRFVGKATATDSSHEIFGKNSDKVEGGFFGDNAEELAGKFMADEGSLFAVFAGKRGDVGDTLETKFDANTIATKDLSLATMDTFGNVAYLVIDGKRLPLLPQGVTGFDKMDFNHTAKIAHNGKDYQVTVCCNNLDYVKFGSYASVNGDKLEDGQLFIIGERTPTSAIPTTGTAHYRGTWEGFIHSKDGKVWNTSASNSESGSRSRFDFNFGDKSFTGKLIANNGLEDSPTFTLAGVISGNGFTGTAKTKAGGFNIDGGSTAGGTLVNIEATVNGGFYGTDASEIGGTISGGNGDKVGGVFGGKRQVKK